MLRPLILPCVALGIACATVPAAAQPLDVKPGLWEVSSTRSSAGMPQIPQAPQIPPELLARMPPEQRARIESAMRAAQGQADGTRLQKICVTRETLQRGMAFGADRPPSCKQTIRTQSRTALEVQQNCTERGGQQTIHMRYEAPRPDIMSGTVEIAMNAGGRQTTMKNVMQGRWVGPDCGDVKPK